MTKLSNVKRSGGPRTAAGKAIAARNSLKTGAYSSAMILPGESEIEFKELKDSLLVDLQAVGMMESALVNELAVIVWKKLRVDQVEHRSVLQRLNERFTPESFYGVGLPSQREFDIALNHPWFWESDCPKYIDQARELVIRLLEEDTRPEVLIEIKQKLPVLYWRMVNRVRYMLRPEALFRVRPEDFEHLKTLAQISGDWNNVMGLVWQELSFGVAKELSALEFALGHKPMIEALIPQVMDQRLMQMVQMDGVVRARDDLDRAFFRILKELRAQQEWRLKHRVVDVTPNQAVSKTD